MIATALVARPWTGTRRTVQRPLIGLILVAVGLALIIKPSAAGSVRSVIAGPLPSSVPAQTERKVATAYGKLPLAFIPNAGQTDAPVRYSAQSGGASFYFTPTEAVFAFAGERKGHVLRLAFVGANPTVEIVGRRRGPGKVNYLLGNNPAGWHTGLPTYGEIAYRELWPGIDLAFRGQGGTLKYEFRLAPGADLGDIRLAYGGAERLSLGGAGELRLHTALGVLRDSRPLSYQQIGGTRVLVESRFALDRRGGGYGFAVGAYDPRQPLVIDPGLLYSTYLGGSGGDFGSAITVDATGNAYVTGTTSSTDFPTTVGAFDTSLDGFLNDAFVAKLNATGSALVYSTYLGGNGNDDGRAIALDAAGNAHVAGLTASTNFPTTVGAFDGALGGPDDAFLTKLNATGSALVSSTYLGGSGNDDGRAIALDAAGNAHVTGGTSSTDFPTTVGAFDTSHNGSADVFVTKLNALGSAPLLYSTYLGGSSADRANGIALDAAGAAHVTGQTNSMNFPLPSAPSTPRSAALTTPSQPN